MYSLFLTRDSPAYRWVWPASPGDVWDTCSRSRPPSYSLRPPDSSWEHPLKHNFISHIIKGSLSVQVDRSCKALNIPAKQAISDRWCFTMIQHVLYKHMQYIMGHIQLGQDEWQRPVAPGNLAVPTKGTSSPNFKRTYSKNKRKTFTCYCLK